MIRAVLFDFDGTLADSFTPITASVNHVRGLHGLPALTEAEVREFVGLGLPQLMRDIVPGLAPGSAVAEYAAHHRTVMLTQTKLLPGVPETLRILAERGYPLAVCSNKRVDFTRQLVAALGLADRFAEVLGPDDVGGEAKPHPAMLLEAARRLGVAPADALYVGDMAVDVHAARAGGLPVWLVPGGASGRENPLDAGPDRALNDFGELAALLPGASP